MIIQSLLDNDFYQFTMSHMVWTQNRNMNVRYEFRNRTFEVPLARCIDLQDLRSELKMTQTLSIQSHEADYLRSLGYFSGDWIDWLSNGMRLPDVEIDNNNGHLVLEYEGPWASAIFWESMILAIISEMYYRRFHASTEEGLRRLREKIGYLSVHPFLKIAEFGTRRRFSRQWQHYVTHELREAIPENIVGTSNVLLAKELGLSPVGTMAHQLFMVNAANFEAHTEHLSDRWLQNVSIGTLLQWKSCYESHPELMTLLPDTFTTQSFMDDIPFAYLEAFTGARQDSGNPIEIGEMIIGAYEQHGIDPTTKRLVFSDGLDLRTINVLYDRFAHRIPVSFGWGTNLTNDLGFQGLSMVIKPKSVEGVGCVKLSDDLAKATGTREDIERYRRWIQR